MDTVKSLGRRRFINIQKQKVRGFVAEFFQKIEPNLKKAQLVVHVKLYSKGGKPKYAIHIKAISGKILFESSHAHAYELAKSFHMAFNDVLKQILHKFRTDVSRK